MQLELKEGSNGRMSLNVAKHFVCATGVFYYNDRCSPKHHKHCDKAQLLSREEVLKNGKWFNHRSSIVQA
jgi:hypothetical protein